ncbi:sll1062 [Synechocystis sp. PCC 6803]|jgi:hypothetical protein|uniref:Sll1062 protein n=1 Tax=Synechocystis sp. (strain ATCC 27184 / PCC 6803 / Kazusa) TaxID=1111708 RepID=P72635_SYNY3|nr:MULTISPECIES: hypothetical protein [unclassified Synechocystis]BAM50336.1 hypothetical protein BEST7613_1405 [Synechocystis sp. PCC 6803] [Bacillus subtilis BEST7613]AGF50326.1 hypothetical protein MYO_1590 [Synechocystis sp. PCC 6803]ALJ66421.1 hypothetical protein AOY38_00295 [Synechocystis sp. PCC 6803]AVP88270.1 hypothetical protein C7I86_00300 [Synechocystis sp. IPPAS B-1465]MBD2619312.1 hypothetical protein [Synechocystis sp. FACHB-898]
MSKFSKLLDQLDEIDQQDTKNTAKLLGATAVLYERLQEIVNRKTTQFLDQEKEVNKEFLIKHFGNYRNTYSAYNKTYGIKAKGWDSLLPKIKSLPVPQSLEDRVKELETQVQYLAQIFGEFLEKN